MGWARRTPTPPPPLSGMNSTPAASKVNRKRLLFEARMAPPRSKARIETALSAVCRESSDWVQSNGARAPGAAQNLRVEE